MSAGSTSLIPKEKLFSCWNCDTPKCPNLDLNQGQFHTVSAFNPLSLKHTHALFNSIFCSFSPTLHIYMPISIHLSVSVVLPLSFCLSPSLSISLPLLIECKKLQWIFKYLYFYEKQRNGYFSGLTGKEVVLFQKWRQDIFISKIRPLILCR